jgi:P-type Ca2+ transporter type 2C
MISLSVVEEGTSVPADGTVIRCNDFTVNEAILTGESLPVEKQIALPDNKVYQGTHVASGLAIIQVTAVGPNTTLAQLGKTLESIQQETSPLQLQLNSFVKRMAVLGIIVFVVVWSLNFSQSNSIAESLLKSLTLAMSILPEEIPVAFTTFMALGAWRLMQSGILVKQIKTVETLGSATVICLDKTGTITENEMELAKIFVHSKRQVFATSATDDVAEIVTLGMWASEPIAFDPMEKALHRAYGRICHHDERSDFRLVHEYPLSGSPPYMTHIFEDRNGNRKIAAKGAPESLLKLSRLSP